MLKIMDDFKRFMIYTHGFTNPENNSAGIGVAFFGKGEL